MTLIQLMGDGVNTISSFQKECTVTYGLLDPWSPYQLYGSRR